MTHLVKIGNSQGIRIPKSLIEQSRLEGKELKLQVVEEGLLIAPSKMPREGWQQSIDKILSSQGVEQADQEWLDASLTTDEDVEW
ncbi:MAG: AbrB/MazE/SpoVT family DNA-binding domain-containing protein [Woeseiaceae bacterium]